MGLWEYAQRKAQHLDLRQQRCDPRPRPRLGRDYGNSGPRQSACCSGCLGGHILRPELGVAWRGVASNHVIVVQFETGQHRDPLR